MYDKGMRNRFDENLDSLTEIVFKECFTTQKCFNKSSSHEEYFDIYEEFLTEVDNSSGYVC